jgi:hypothetical protein
MNCLSLATSTRSLAASPSLDRSSKTINPFRGNEQGEQRHFPVLRERSNRKLRLVPGFRKGRGYRLLAITREIVDSRSLTIFFFGSLTLLILKVPTLLT